MRLKELVTHGSPDSEIAEAFRTLRTNIQFMATSKEFNTLLITSTFPGEGKSWISSNLAITFAKTGKRVILIDADMRKGRQHTIFDISPKPGLSDYLSKPEENELASIIQETEVENLSIISGGSVPPNPSELLSSSKIGELIEELKHLSDIIIIDGTPCELVTDSVILSRLADSTLIVTAYKETKKDNLEKVIKSIKNVGGNLAGVVINKMPVNPSKEKENNTTKKEG